MAAAEEEAIKDIVQNDEQEAAPAEEGAEQDQAAPRSGDQQEAAAAEEPAQEAQGEENAEVKETNAADGEAGGDPPSAAEGGGAGGEEAETAPPAPGDEQAEAKEGEEEGEGGNLPQVAAPEEGEEAAESAAEGDERGGGEPEAPPEGDGGNEDKGEGGAGEEVEGGGEGGQETDAQPEGEGGETAAAGGEQDPAGEEGAASDEPAGGPDETGGGEEGRAEQLEEGGGDGKQEEEPTFEEVMAQGAEQAMEEEGEDRGGYDLDKMVDAALDKNSQVMSRASAGKEQLRISDSDLPLSQPASRAEQGPSASSQQLKSRIAQLEAQLEVTEQGKERAETEAWERQEEMTRVLAQKDALQAEVKALRGQMDLELNARREAADRMWADMSEEAVHDGGKPKERMQEQAPSASMKEEDSDFIDPPRSRYHHQPFTFGEDDQLHLLPQHAGMEEQEHGGMPEELPGGAEAGAAAGAGAGAEGAYGGSKGAGERLKEELTRKNELILELRIQVGQLETQLRSAQDMNQFRSEMEMERIRQDAEWQRRMAMEEIARMRHELEIANAKKARLKELLADNLHELRDQRRQTELLKTKISGLFGKMENITRQFVQEQSFLRDFQNVRQSIDEIKKESEMQLQALDHKHKDFVNAMRADMQEENSLQQGARELREDFEEEEENQPRGPLGPGLAPRRRQDGMKGGERKGGRGQGMPEGKQKISPSKKPTNEGAGQLKKEEGLIQHGERMEQPFPMLQQRPMFGFPMPMANFFSMPHVPGDPMMMPEKQQGMGHENPQMRRGGMDPPYDDPHMFNNFPPGYPQMPMLANPFGMPGQLASAGLQHMPNAGDPQLGSPARRMNAHPLDPDMQQFMEDDWWRAPGEAQSQEHAAGKPQSFLPAIDGGGRGNKGRTPPPGKKDASRAQQNRNPARKK